MKVKYTKILGLMALGFGVVVSYQNCGQIKPGLNVVDSKLSAAGSARAIVQDGEGNIQVTIADVPAADIPAAIEPAVDPSMPAEVKPPQIAEHHEEGEKDDHHGEIKIDKDAELQESDVDCAELAKKHGDEAIDLSAINSTSKLSVLKGKTFIYSSGGNDSIKDVEIGESCGRTVLCGVHVDRIKVKKGRLDLLRSTVREIEEDKGTVK